MRKLLSVSLFLLLGGFVFLFPVLTLPMGEVQSGIFISYSMLLFMGSAMFFHEYRENKA